MITEAIVLAGGLGTRLQSVVKEIPKSLAPVAGKPFLAYLLDYAKGQGIERFVFALGYKAETIESFVKKYLRESKYAFSTEKEPLGTGGAIYKACDHVMSENVIVLNADTFFGIQYAQLAELHDQRKASCTLALKKMEAFDRYGSVSINDKNVITGFSEKKYQASGYINGGVYALKVESFLGKTFPGNFSFEKEYLEKEYVKENFPGLVSEAYFIDIGVPDDYHRAQMELPGAILNC
jgi:D-glycero-alpha-D-manno-heptose 1-phosphate guanylyltransferase